MLFEIPYFDQLPKTYREAVEKLDKDLKETQNPSVERKIFIEFIKTFTTITPIWSYWKANGKTVRNWYDNLMEQQISHFYSFSLILDYGFLKQYPLERPFNRTLYQGGYGIILNKKHCRNWQEYKEFIQYSEAALKYPSEDLPKIYLNYRIKLGSMLSDEMKARYQKSMCQLEELQAAGNDDVKWVESLLKVKDEDFIIKNFEFRLEASPWYSRLWKCYIEYLKSINSAVILNVYSRYCRFFLEDEEMRDAYRNEVERMERKSMDVTKWWIDIIKFEPNLINACEILKRALTCATRPSNKLIKFAQHFCRKLSGENAKELKETIKVAKLQYSKCDCAPWTNDILSNPLFADEYLCYESDGTILFVSETAVVPEQLTSVIQRIGNFDTYIPQEFDLPKTICSYIFQAPPYRLRHKLLSTCKYFVLRYQTPICCNIVITLRPASEYYDQSIKLSESLIPLVKNFYVVNSLDAWESENPLTISKLCLNVHQFDLKFLKLHTQSFTWKEFEFLTAPGNIESVNMINVSIVGPAGEEATFEEIFERFPKSSRISFFFRTRFSPETAQNLLKQNRVAKIEKFDLNTFQLDIESFCQFLKKNLASNAVVNFALIENVNGAYFELIRNELDNFANSWMPKEEKPLIDVIRGVF